MSKQIGRIATPTEHRFLAQLADRPIFILWAPFSSGMNPKYSQIADFVLAFGTSSSLADITAFT